MRSKRPAPITASTSASMMICKTLSATERRKSASPLFESKSASGSLSSVIGCSFSSVEVRNSTLAADPDDHLSLHPKIHHIRGRYRGIASSLVSVSDAPHLDFARFKLGSDCFV